MLALIFEVEMESPCYSYKPIYSIDSLALMLGEAPELLKQLAVNANKLYRYVPQEKKDGSPRDTYDAHEPLKRVQRKIVDRLLARVKYPDYLHGGIRDSESPRSIYSNARPHSGARTVVLQDIENFFPSITVGTVLCIFKGFFNFSDEVSVLLVRLVTRDGTVPQGASTSSYLANLVFWDVEHRLVRWVRSNKMTYSRFADDITISSVFDMPVEIKTDVVRKVTGMLAAKGFTQKRKKMHVMKKGQTTTKSIKVEPAIVTGLTVMGGRPSVPKQERNKIRAAVKTFEIMMEVRGAFVGCEGVYNSAMGRVGRLLACGQTEGFALKERLNNARMKFNTPLLERHRLSSNGSIERAEGVDLVGDGKNPLGD
jgi:hypothetical protein